jgi:hypothetical protein
MMLLGRRWAWVYLTSLRLNHVVSGALKLDVLRGVGSTPYDDVLHKEEY